MAGWQCLPGPLYGSRNYQYRILVEPYSGPMRAAFARFIVRHPWFTLAAGGIAVAVLAALVVVSGVVPIKASSGHWAITARLLDFAKLRSVATYSTFIDPPPLDDDLLVVRGAAHYEGGCLPCHGAPGAVVAPVMAAMTPQPPALLDRLARYEPEELFYIVKHGIKLTGMPAWSAQQRDDEVWAVVAFLRKMPELDPAAYRRLARGQTESMSDLSSDIPRVGPTPPPEPVRGVCWRCHGTDGIGRGEGAFPSLAGQRAEYLYASLRAYAGRQRFSGIMTNVAANLTDDAMQQAAQYYSGLSPRHVEQAMDTSAFARGQRIASLGVPDRDIPACIECHGPTDAPKNPSYPRLAGQHRRYLASQLQLLKARERGGSVNVNLMHVFVDRLRPEDIRDASVYFSSLPQPATTALP